MRSCRKRLQTGHSRSGSMIGVFSLRQRRYLKICLFPAAPTDYFRSLSLPPPSVFQIIQGSCNHSRRQEPINNDNAAMISRIRQVLVHLGFYGLQHTHKQTHTHTHTHRTINEETRTSLTLCLLLRDTDNPISIIKQVFLVPGHTRVNTAIRVSVWFNLVRIVLKLPVVEIARTSRRSSEIICQEN